MAAEATVAAYVADRALPRARAHLLVLAALVVVAWRYRRTSSCSPSSARWPAAPRSRSSRSPASSADRRTIANVSLWDTRVLRPMLDDQETIGRYYGFPRATMRMLAPSPVEFVRRARRAAALGESVSRLGVTS
jgi:hypothetical protein